MRMAFFQWRCAGMIARGTPVDKNKTDARARLYGGVADEKQARFWRHFTVSLSRMRLLFFFFIKHSLPAFAFAGGCALFASRGHDDNENI